MCSSSEQTADLEAQEKISLDAVESVGRMIRRGDEVRDVEWGMKWAMQGSKGRKARMGGRRTEGRRGRWNFWPL